jgi:hypothetical protein
MRRVAKPRLDFPKPTEEEIRKYAYQLYVESGCVPGRDLENWQEAESRLRAKINLEKAHAGAHPKKRT